MINRIKGFRKVLKHSHVVSLFSTAMLILSTSTNIAMYVEWLRVSYSKYYEYLNSSYSDWKPIFQEYLKNLETLRQVFSFQQNFWFKYQSFTLRKVCKRIYLCFWLLLNLLFQFLLIQMYTCWDMRILGQKAVFLWFFDKYIPFSGCIMYAEIFSFVYGWIKAPEWCSCVTIEHKWFG